MMQGRKKYHLRTMPSANNILYEVKAKTTEKLYGNLVLKYFIRISQGEPL